MKKHIIDEVDGFYRVIELVPFRHTKGVEFDILPMSFLPKIDGIDRVLHEVDALSPGSIDGIERPWYMHPEQEDNLIVLHGVRTVDIYTLEHRQPLTFVVEPDRILKDGRLLYKGPAMLVWPRRVFHRIKSGAQGSASLNFAVRAPGIDMKTNFNIYDLNLAANSFRMIRAGYLDQT
ncbi:MAG: hypothetical protein A2087_13910 [Spirochaetes bacterium GWD1_61_31]|nr:MAG: hypothetical protein A2Y37_04875 [Spirochaetes bacterium GWB1_60_80]OHD29123.1 MAG: hypothetical protein A2004_10645 [Spirochaetes bacterium GWC1_61_12]OHD41879.1 MAG: hypothetical protein A2087_13910 [Spirochaetes bacterium GWD1_61_31]OHD43711.1 MAG: hypothetical protein A2Y35_00070 [Spirochaetes bacterium GWE1_60_18]OHD60193.1 MAG: hypothetical protein A2Y32_07115 [Spirochaetes bacterium GWF1_60_12]HAP42541.1 hypothetical protein [Spirochaetaceae bacterium]